MLCWPRARLLSRRFLMKKITFPLLLVLVAALLAGCGSGSSASLKSDDVATVGKVHISKAAFAALLVQAKKSYSSQTPPKAFPKPGTADYETIKGQADCAARPAGRARAEGRLSRGQDLELRHREAPQPDQEAVFRRQRDEVPGPAEEAEPDRCGGPRGRPAAADLGGALRQGDEEHEGLGQRRCTPITWRTRPTTRRLSHEP